MGYMLIDLASVALGLLTMGLNLLFINLLYDNQILACVILDIT